MKNHQKKDYYSILELNKNATQDDIKKSYKDKVKLFHPDITTDENKKKELEEKFKEISEAYEILSNQDKRKKYDFGDEIFSFDDFGGINIEDLLFGMKSRGNFSNPFSSNSFFNVSQFNKSVDIDFDKLLSENEDVELDIHEIRQRIKFKLPSDFKPGQTYQLKLNGNNKNQAIIINLQINVNIPKFTIKQKEEIKKILKEIKD